MNKFDNLNWEDIKFIIATADNLLDSEENLLDLYPTEESYYKEILKRIKSN